MEELLIKRKIEVEAEISSMIDSVRNTGKDELILAAESFRQVHRQNILRLEAAERYLKDIKSTAFLARMGDHSSLELCEILRKIQMIAARASEVFYQEPEDV